MKQTLTQLKPWIPVIFWMGVIYIASSISVLPGSAIVWWDFIIKKSAHIIVYAILFYLIYRADNANRGDAPPRYWPAFLITFLYACFDEWHQSWVPGRNARLYDVGFDMFGSWLSYLYIKQKPSK